MKVYIYGTEGRYQGLHGIYVQAVIEVDSLEEANDYAYEEVLELSERYDIEKDKYFEEEYYWCIYKIKDSITLSVRELDRLCNKLGNNLFIKEYCESEPLD